MNKSHKNLSEYIKHQRMAHNITQLELSKHLGYSTAQFISNWERGLAGPPMNKMSKLVKILKLDVHMVMELYLDQAKKTLERGLRLTRN